MDRDKIEKIIVGVLCGHSIEKAVDKILKLHQEQVKNNQILQDLLKEQEEIIMSPIRFNGVHVDKIKQVFAKHGIEFEQQF